jgi:hypothetical protein
MAAGPAPIHMRYAIKHKLYELNDGLRVSLIGNPAVYLNSSEIKKPTDKSHFAILTLTFYRTYLNNYVSYDIELSNQYLPRWITNENVAFEETMLGDVKDVLNLWALKNIPLF